MRRGILIAAVALATVPAGHASAQTPFVPSIPGDEATVWAVGDGAAGLQPAKDLAARIASDRPDRFLYLGDVYSHGTALQYENNYKGVYGALDPITAPTIGNHEWANRDTGYNPYWTAARGVPAPEYYAFSAGGWQFLSLNSETARGPGSSQVSWLRRKIRSTPSFGRCRVAFFHRPLISAGDFGDESVRALWTEVVGRAALVLNGHEHNSQRFDPVKGTTELIAGAGAVPVPVNHPGHPLLAWSDGANLAAVRLRLTPRRATFEFIAPNGVVLNSGSTTCKPKKKKKARKRKKPDPKTWSPGGKPDSGMAPAGSCNGCVGCPGGCMLRAAVQRREVARPRPDHGRLCPAGKGSSS